MHDTLTSPYHPSSQRTVMRHQDPQHASEPPHTTTITRPGLSEYIAHHSQTRDYRLKREQAIYPSTE